MALLILLNSILCLFDLSYLSLRSFYNRTLPEIVQIYDPVKGITPHPLVQQYLESVDQLSAVILDGQNPSMELRSLQQQSINLLAENPFAETDQDEDLGQLKRLIRLHTQAQSSAQGLAQLWNDEFSGELDWSTRIEDFNQTFRPILERAYNREIDQNGWFADYFWKIDRFFLIIFAFDILIRITLTSYRYPNLKWKDAVMRHWYDGLLFLPFWRWLRIIPTIVRLHQSRLLNVESFVSEATHEPAAYISERVTQFLLVRLINQLQETLSEGELLDIWHRSENYVQMGETDKLERIIDRLLKVTIYRVLPEVQPNVETLLRHSIKEALKQSDLVQGAAALPGVSHLSAEAIEQFSGYLSVSMYQVLAESYADEAGKEMLDNVYEQFQQNLRRELHTQPIQWELKQLLMNTLEEFKVNYIQRTVDRDPKMTLTEVTNIQQAL